MELNEVIHNFKVIKKQEVEELKGTLYEMVHVKTNASLLFLDNKEQNKLFSVAFKTLPENDTGVFHILEHSVLCGSAKYPVKEPFVELIKSSMNTFLNAMTFPDKTVYPISSRNKKDFLNLTAVYLDAVFAPAILHNANIFYQEGWHIEYDGKTQASYKGVVFNEMKGALSSCDELMETEMNRLLFEDNCYKYVSGGDPVHIPDLTYEMFINSYKRYYHPSNARFYLDGDVPLEETLALIASYLDHYDPIKVDHVIPKQMAKPFKSVERVYESGKEEDDEHKVQVALGKVIASFDENVKGLAINVLADYLTGSNDSPLKRALLEKGLGQDVTLNYLDGLYQNLMILKVSNTDEGKKEEILKVIRETIAELVKKGLDKEELKASINYFEFVIKEPMEPAGLMRNLNALNSWLYDGDPLTYMVNDDAFKQLNDWVETNKFEMLLKEMFLEEEGQVYLEMLPSKTIGDDHRKAEADRVNKTIADLDEKGRQDLLSLNEKLTDWQKTPDSKEALSMLPSLDLSEVNRTPEPFCQSISENLGITILHNDTNTSDIIHLKCYFNLSDASDEELSSAELLCSCLGMLNTQRHSTLEIARMTKQHVGRLHFSVSASGKDKDLSQATPYFAISCSLLKEKEMIAIDLLKEILYETVFDPARLKEIVLQEDENALQELNNAGHTVALCRAISSVSAIYAAKDIIGGFEYYKWLHDLAIHFDEKIDHVITSMKHVIDTYLCRSGLTVSKTINGDYDETNWINVFKEGKCTLKERTFKTDHSSYEGIVIPSSVSYAIAANKTDDFKGTALIATNILSYSYLWNVVRVQGGAYGTGCSIKPNGLIYCYSYRDPSPKNSLMAYKGLAKALEAFSQSDESIDKYIISTIAQTEPLMTPRELGMTMDNFYFRGYTYEDSKRIRKEMLETTKESLLVWSAKIEKAMEAPAVCVVGCKDALNLIEDLTYESR